MHLPLKNLFASVAIAIFSVFSACGQWSTSGNSATGTEVLGTTNSEPLTIITNNTTQMLIKPDGTIGIGTDKTTGFKLSVDGDVRCRELVVNLDTWSDYVFDSCYRLANLDTLEKNIQNDKHLPGIPSAAEVANNGVSVGEMNKLLLAKVEELTLYVIQLNKKVEELEQCKQ
jgi:hypothetical protein